MTTTTAVRILMFFILTLGCEGVVRVEIDPPHLRVSEDTIKITITCRSSAPITGCQFSWWRRDLWTSRAGPVLDLNKGAESVAEPAHIQDKYGYGWRPLLDYSYSGRGLSSGDCGVRMEVKEFKLWLISCRVKTADTWVYNWMDLTASGWDPLPHTLEPRREVVVLEGGQARILLKTHGGPVGCQFNLPGNRRLSFDKGPSSSDSTGRHLYQGAGLSGGECGLALLNITEEDNGLVDSRILKTSPNSDDYRLTPIIVARAPTAPVLTVSETYNHITATCRVESSRPAPNITWFLGDQVIAQDDSPSKQGDESWRWPWTAGSWSHTIAFSIQPQDSGKVLKCSLAHVALTRPLEAAKDVQFTGTLAPHVTHSSTSTTTPKPTSIPSTDPIHRPTTPTPSSRTSTLSTSPIVPDSQEKSPVLVGGACQELWAGWVHLQNTCCLKGGAATQLDEEIRRLTLEAAKSRASQEVANAETAAVQLEVTKIKAEAAKTIILKEVEEAKTKAEAAHLELEMAKAKAETVIVQLEAAKTKAQQEVEAARTWNRIAEEELEFMRESNRMRLNNTWPLLDVRMGD